MNEESSKESTGKEQKSGESAEIIEWSGKPILFAFWPLYSAGALTLILAVIIESTRLTLPVVVWGMILLFVAVMFFLPSVFQRAWRFTLTSQKVRSRFALWVRRVKEAPLEKVTDIVAEQGVIARLFGFGVVRVDTAGTPFSGVRFWGIRKPFDVAERIRKEKNKRTQSIVVSPLEAESE